MIGELGWGSVTTRGVAERAGVNPALVNYHFGGKSQLMIAAMSAAMAELLEELSPMLSAETLDELVDAALDFVQRRARSETMRVLLETTLQAPLDPAVASLIVPQIQNLRKLIAERVRDVRRPGERFRDPESVAIVIAAALDGLMLHALADPDTDLDRAAAGLRVLLRYR